MSDGAEPVDDVQEDGDVNRVDTETPTDDDAGNRRAGGTSLAVVRYLLDAIVAEPDAVVIDTEERSGTVRFRIHVAPDDMGRVIGRRGRVAQAIRTVVAAAGARDGVSTNVDIVDD